MTSSQSVHPDPDNLVRPPARTFIDWLFVHYNSLLDVWGQKENRKEDPIVFLELPFGVVLLHGPLHNPYIEVVLGRVHI